MNIGIKISKKLVLRLAIFMGVLAAAIVLDVYFDNNSVEINTTENEPRQSADEYATVYFLGQTSNVATKISVQKNSNRKLLGQHDKYLQRYHESKNFRDFKADRNEPKTPLFIAFHHLLFRNYYFPVPDDEPHLS